MCLLDDGNPHLVAGKSKPRSSLINRGLNSSLTLLPAGTCAVEIMGQRNDSGMNDCMRNTDKTETVIEKSFDFYG